MATAGLVVIHITMLIPGIINEFFYRCGAIVRIFRPTPKVILQCL